MTPEQLTSWPTPQLRDALGRYADDYSASARLRIQDELERRGLGTVGVTPRPGIEGFVDAAAGTAGAAHRTYLLAALVCGLISLFGLTGFYALAQGEAVHSERLALSAVLILAVKFLFDAAEARPRRAA